MQERKEEHLEKLIKETRAIIVLLASPEIQPDSGDPNKRYHEVTLSFFEAAVGALEDFRKRMRQAH